MFATRNVKMRTLVIELPAVKERAVAILGNGGKLKVKLNRISVFQTGVSKNT